MTSLSPLPLLVLTRSYDEGEYILEEEVEKHAREGEGDKSCVETSVSRRPSLPPSPRLVHPPSPASPILSSTFFAQGKQRVRLRTADGGGARAGEAEEEIIANYFLIDY